MKTLEEKKTLVINKTKEALLYDDAEQRTQVIKGMAYMFIDYFEDWRFRYFLDMFNLTIGNNVKLDFTSSDVDRIIKDFFYMFEELHTKKEGLLTRDDLDDFFGRENK